MDKYQKVIEVFESRYVDVPLESFKTPYEILVSTIMSARTNDDTTLPAAKRLFKQADDFTALSQLPVAKIEKLIFPVGFYKTKAKNIKQAAKIIVSKHKGKVPSKKSDLLRLPGVGNKTANLVLNRAFDIPEIAVDTHVHRISNLLGWVQTSKPEDTERELKKTVPKKYWSKINRLFVSIGRQYRSEKQLREFLRENNLLK
jgi:endonuclease-3